MSTDTYATPTSGGAAAVGSTPTIANSPTRRTVPAPPRPRRPRGLVPTVSPSTPRVDVGPQPRLRQLVGVCLWAALIGGVALVTAVRALIGSLGADPPSWYLPWVSAVGTAGLGSTIAAFVTVNRKWVPFALLGVSTVLVIVALNFTAHAF